MQEGAVNRRRFLDESISTLRPRYGSIISEYTKNLEQKTAILKDYREKPSLLEILDEYNLQLARLSARIIRYRASFIKRLEEEAKKLNLEISSGKEELKFEYETLSEVKDPSQAMKRYSLRCFQISPDCVGRSSTAKGRSTEFTATSSGFS